MKRLYLYLLANFLILVILAIISTRILLTFYLRSVDDSEGIFIQFLSFLIGILSMQASIFLNLSSITIFLNLIPVIRANRLLSFLSFCGVSLGCFLFMFCENLLSDHSNWEAFFEATKPYLIALLTQFVLTFISFIIFRKRFKNFEPQE